MSPFPQKPPVTLRPARGSDVRAIARLVALHGLTPLRGPALVALRGRRVVAAIAMHGGRVVADPCVPTAREVALLRVRRQRELRGGHGHRTPLRCRSVVSSTVAAGVH
jgi:hypothetical protein